MSTVRRVTASQLVLADRIKLEGMDEWNTCIVKSIDAYFVTLWRPYGTTSGFEDSSGVICYMGLEEFKVSLLSSSTFIVTSKENLK